MAYVKPTIDETGLHIPLYSDIRDDLLNDARRIYGEDMYLEPDSQDYELIAEFSDKLHDAYQLIQQAYNNRSPHSAVGAGLDAVVKINGIRRKGSTHGQCPVIVAGEPGTKIFGGIVGDNNEHMWDIGDVVIPASGSVEVIAVCQDTGQIFADAGTITKIITQTRGWVSVINRVNATPGQNSEADPVLRSRQSISTARPSKTVLQGTMGGLAEILDVIRSRVYENDTNTPDENGIPGHSIAVVVEGGEAAEIAKEIYLRKTPGCGTYGDVEVDPLPFLDPVTETLDSVVTYNTIANPPPIRFFRPGYVDVVIVILVKKLYGFVDQIEIDIRQKLLDYLNALDIGEDLTVSALYSAAMEATPEITSPVFSIHSITIGLSDGDQSRDDMEIGFNQVTRGIAENIRMTLI